MKLAIFLTGLMLSVSARAELPLFSAFVADNDLHVTIMEDCNSVIGARLEVDALCRGDRLTQNYASECAATLVYSKTRKFCPAVPPKPRVLTIKLNDSNIAQEAELLRLTHQSQEIEVRIK